MTNSESTGKLVEIRNKQLEGNADTGQMIDDAIGSLPIVGGIWGAGRNIHELFTGDQFKQKQEDETQKTQEEFHSARLDLFRGMIEDRRKMQDEVYQADTSARISSEWRTPQLQERDALDAQREAIKRKNDDELRHLNDSVKGADEARKAANARVAEDTEKYGQAMAVLARNQRTTPTFGGRIPGIRAPWEDWQGINFMMHGLPDSWKFPDPRIAVNSTNADLNEALRDRQSLEASVSDQKRQLGAGMSDESAARNREIDQQEMINRDKINHEEFESLRAHNNAMINEDAAYYAKKRAQAGDSLGAERVMITTALQRRQEETNHQLEEDIRTHAGETDYINRRSAQAAQENRDAFRDYRQDDADAVYRDKIKRRGDADALSDMGGRMMEMVASLPGAKPPPELQAEMYKFRQTTEIRNANEDLDDQLKEFIPSGRSKSSKSVPHSIVIRNLLSRRRK